MAPAVDGAEEFGEFLLGVLIRPRHGRITLSTDAVPIMVDFAAGHPTNEQSHAIVAALDEALGNGRDGVRFHQTADPDVAAVLTVIGGFNSNELLPYLDWDLIAANPKVLCGFSDITALQNAILARTGLVTYSGPHWSSFGMRDHFEQTLAWFTQALFTDEPVHLDPAASWTDDLWFLDQAT